MQANEVLIDAFGRVRRDVHGAVSGLDEVALAHRLDPDANSVAWLVWHLTRVMDDHVSDLAGTEQVSTAEGWAERLALPVDPGAIGYGQSSAEVGAIGDAGVAAGDLLGYHDAVVAMTLEYLRGIGDADLDEVIDDRWDPPVTRGVRLVSVVNDTTQHAGQAAFAAGVVSRLRST